MTFVYFAHSLDQKLLEQSARSLRRIYDNPKIFIFWEAGKEGHLQDAENITTHFERGGNLNGIDCCKGIIESMIFTGGDKVAKIDCDTILVKPIEDYSGFWFLEAVHPFRGVGPCYSIEREVLKLCQQKLANYVAMPRARYEEDSTISVLCYLVSKGTLKLCNGGEHIVGYGYDKNWKFLAEKQVVHFGNADPSCDKRIKKARDAAHMKLFLDYLDSEI